MTQTSQQLGTAKEEHAPSISLQGPTLLKFAAALVFACGLALAPAPALAQHGGGGGGGGAHGGGGGGGSHGSSGGGFGGGHAGAPSSNSSGAHASGGNAGSSGGSSNSSSGGHSWNPFHSGGAKSAAPAKGTSTVPAGNIKSESNATSTHFAAGNNTWQEPPRAGMSAGGRVNYYGPANVNGTKPFVPIATTTRAPMNSGTSAHGATMVAAAQHPFQPVRPGYPYYPYYPFFGYNPYYGAFGFGFGGYGPCNPFWGCFGYGFGYGYGFGGGLGYFGATSGGYNSGGYNSGWTDAAAEGSANVTSPDNTDSYLLAAPGTGGGEAVDGSSNGTQELRTDAAPQQTYVLLYLKDGTSFAVSDYWLADGKLHYVTSYGGDNSVDESQVDLQRTVNENATRGVDFTLKPQAGGSGSAATSAPTPAPAQNSEPQKPQQ
jgi:hypothetical protein